MSTLGPGRYWRQACGLTLVLGALSSTACDRVAHALWDAPLDRDEDGLEADEDCDDSDPEVGGPEEWYYDADGDGWGGNRSTQACETPSGAYVTNGMDCDDHDPDVGPSRTWYPDTDGDGHGGGDPVVECLRPEDDWVASSDDCDDTNADVHPGADETCDGLDNDCDEATDEEAVDATTWYLDADGDSHGTSEETREACEQPDGYTELDDDCDDTDAEVNPDADEQAGDGVDNNCDGDVDLFYLADSEYLLLGSTEEGNAGYSVAFAGDVQGDGFLDVLIGAPNEDTPASAAGVAYLASGPISGVTYLSSATAILRGEHEQDLAGYSVSGVGDVNGDGLDDILVGAPGVDSWDTGAGAAFLFLGPVTGELDMGWADATVLGRGINVEVGEAIAGAGDVDGDGLDDMLVGSPSMDPGGEVYLVRGTALGAVGLVEPDATLQGETAGDRAGCALAGAGDMNGDGLDDFLVGAEGASDSEGHSYAGAAYLVLGPVSGEFSLTEAQAKLQGAMSDQAGHAVTSPGDVDLDGHRDVLVGAQGADTLVTNAGAAFLALGPLTGTLSIYDLAASYGGETNGDRAGYRVAAGGDPNNDGTLDLLVGAPLADTDGNAFGSAYLLLSPPLGDSSLGAVGVKYIGRSGNYYAGNAIAGGGDVDGDGIDDLIFGMPFADRGGSNAGEVCIIPGTGGS